MGVLCVLERFVNQAPKQFILASSTRGAFFHIPVSFYRIFYLPPSVIVMRFTEPAPGIFGRFIHYSTGVAFAQAVKYSENSSARLRIPHGFSQGLTTSIKSFLRESASSWCITHQEGKEAPRTLNHALRGVHRC